MTDIEKMARRLCELDGYHPDATGTFSIPMTHRNESSTIACEAPPMWEMYVGKAKKMLAEMH